MSLAYIGLGSNLGDSRSLMAEAVEGLAQLGQIRVSRLYASSPMGPQDQPDYLNAAVQLNTILSPHALLDQLQALEQAAGRKRLRHWGERTLDLDLLLFDDAKIHTSRLMVPHVGILDRVFVIQPLLDLDSELVVSGQALKSHLLATSTDGIRAISSTSWAEVVYF